jgi:hypothetical protein
VAAQNAIPKIQLLDLAFQSSPIGADVYIVGSNEYLGRTPFRRKVEYRDDRTTFVVFRMVGHMEMTKEVRPDFSGAVTLQEVPAAPAPLPPPPPEPLPPTHVVSPPPVHPASVPNKVDPFEKAKPTRPHGKAHGKGGPKERTDPFDSSSGPSLEHKASPFH